MSPAEFPGFDYGGGPLRETGEEPLFRVQTLEEPRSEPGQGLPLASLPICPCGCQRPVAVKNGKPLKWAGNGCRQRYWNAKHTPLDLSGLSQAKREEAERMVREALRAAKMGQKRATVDARHPVSHEAAAEKPDTRPSCRARLTPETWDDLEVLASLFGLPSRSATVERLVTEAVSRLVAEISPEAPASSMCPAHSEPEPCPVCASYIAAGL